MMICVKYMCRLFQKLDGRLDRIEDELRRLRFLVNRPGRVGFQLSEGLDMAIRFNVVLPEPPAVASDWAEIAKGELQVTINAAEPMFIETHKEAQMTPTRELTDPRFEGPQGSVVQVSFAYIDDAGNRGAAVTAEIVLEDTIPPVAPNAIGIVLKDEVPDVNPDDTVPVL